VNTYSHLIQNQQKSISKVLSNAEGKVVIELVLEVDESCDKFGLISQEAIERTLLFEFVFSDGFPLSKTTLPSATRVRVPSV
jgi:hypothetical protein